MEGTVEHLTIIFLGFFFCLLCIFFAPNSLVFGMWKEEGQLKPRRENIIRDLKDGQREVTSRNIIPASFLCVSLSELLTMRDWLTHIHCINPASQFGRYILEVWYIYIAARAASYLSLAQREGRRHKGRWFLFAMQAPAVIKGPATLTWYFLRGRSGKGQRSGWRRSSWPSLFTGITFLELLYIAASVALIWVMLWRFYKHSNVLNKRWSLASERAHCYGSWVSFVAFSEKW